MSQDVITPTSVVDELVGRQPTGHGRVARKGPSRRHLLLPGLHALQDAFGCISRAALAELAGRLDVPLAEAYGVASFYALLDVSEQGSGVVAHVCDDIVCRRSSALEPPPGATVHPSPCLGQCDRAPAAYVHQPGETARRSVLHAGGGLPDLGWIGEPRLLRRIGKVDPASIDDYVASGGFAALDAATALGRAGVVDAIKASGLRGRGGAAFPTGSKWEAVAAAESRPTYVVCNADESEPGTFKDRVLMEGDPFAVIEALVIAMFANSAETAFIYVRGEYPEAEAALQKALEASVASGRLNLDGERLDIQIRRGGGAYICGEETALFNSIEGYRGEPRSKPPYPTEAGLFGRPTVVNNVETLANIPGLLLEPGAPETKLFCVSGDIARPGTYEVPLDTPLDDLLSAAGGVLGELRAILLGGAAGSFIGPERLDLRLGFDSARDAGLSLGSGVVIPFNTDADIADLLVRIARFFAEESCGQCVPCRVGTVRQHEVVLRGRGERELLDDLAAVMTDASICGLGHTASTALQSALDLGLVGGEGFS